MSGPLEQLGGWPVACSSAAVLVSGDVVDEYGQVWAPLPWASVTKLATALAAVIAIDGGHLRLSDPAGPPGSTVRHLLAHASGLDQDTAEIRAAPGHRRIYSNHGYEVLAQTVAAAVGMDFADWLDGCVLAPLGMTATRLVGSPASGMVGPLADLIGLAGELQRPTLVSEEMAVQMRSVAFPGLAGLLPGLGYQPANDWALGPEVRDRKSPHWTGAANSPETFGHFGRAGGFVWIDPRAGVALSCLTDTDFGPWAHTAWPAVSDAVLAAQGHPDTGHPPSVPWNRS